MRRAFLVGMAALALATILTACGGTPWSDSEARRSPTQRDTTADAEGNDRVTIGDAGITLEVPHSWSTFDLTKETIQDMIDSLKEKNPRIAEQMSGTAQGTLSQNGRFFAIDSSSTAGLANNMNVLVFPGEKFDARTADAVREQIESLGATVQGSKVMAVPGGSAHRFEYRLPLTTADGTRTTAHGTQLYVNAPGGVAVVSVTTSGDAAGDRVRNQIVESVALN